MANGHCLSRLCIISFVFGDFLITIFLPIIVFVHELRGLPLLHPAKCKIVQELIDNNYIILVTPMDKDKRPFNKTENESKKGFLAFRQGQNDSCFWGRSCCCQQYDSCHFYIQYHSKRKDRNNFNIIFVPIVITLSVIFGVVLPISCLVFISCKERRPRPTAPEQTGVSERRVVVWG